MKNLGSFVFSLSFVAKFYIKLHFKKITKRLPWLLHKFEDMLKTSAKKFDYKENNIKNLKKMHVGGKRKKSRNVTQFLLTRIRYHNLTKIANAFPYYRHTVVHFMNCVK